MPRFTLPRTAVAGGVAVIAVAALAGCSAGSGATEPSASADLTIGSVDLAAAGCPATVVIQTDWNPEGEHGHLYEMFGDDYTLDASTKAVRGPLMSQGEYTGVDLEVRSGGPAIGFQTVSSQLYLDPEITLGYVSTDEAIQLSDQNPTVAVMAPLDKSPQDIMWDPESYPGVTTIAELAEAGAMVRYYSGAAYMSYLIGAGIIPEDQTDGSFDGTPANFVASGGKDAQQGFASADPYIYENEVPSWNKPITYQLIHDTGYPYYQGALSVKADQLESLSGCFEALVPVLQQAEVDYFADPAAANTLIVDAVEAFDTGWEYSVGVADFAHDTMLEEGLASNGDDGTIGDIDEERVQRIIDITTPIFTDAGTPPVDGLVAGDLFTNEFLDESIGLQ
ncbi:ABC transporter substrate-binding protein [Herbiconiux moechotypicola]|uniref:Nitrate ABC transporter substrate-binding protein n=1 Tax=Herbiconiux moechotypicola TaxID=637393 RepID=A0ABN3DDQ5_9MICO|nr:ABC transporter substrate-binding protein [Herbiconiux moechotypicola]MCS5729183.1 ABC transporter substrate-binding protein [Herbiconiux moechotypicola]